ncbi:MAG: sensor histidine kinase [Gemmatimonadaceae bacterium]
MASIRTRLTTSYAASLLAAVIVFAALVYGARSARAGRELADLAVQRGDLAVLILRQAVGPGATERDTTNLLRRTRIASTIQVALDAIPGYLSVHDESGANLYESPAVVGLRAPGDDRSQAQRAEDVRRFDAALARLRNNPGPEDLELRADDMVLVSRRDPDPTYRALYVVAGVSRDESDIAQRELLGTMFIITPFVLALSVVAALMIGKRAVAPIDQLVNEVEAITDGRSLHKRLDVIGADQEVERLAGTLNDMLGRLESSFGGLRRFTADASHELKTPLAVLRADVERAMTAPSGSTEQLVALEEALQETTRMADLVDSLLTLARADEGRFDLHREVVDVHALAHEVFETAVILGENADLTVSMPQDDPVKVLGDYLRLRQLFLNLITNAIKYSQKGGEVELSLARRDGQAIFTVRDTGIGIAAAELPFIFDRFWRSDRARSRAAERGGFGLGLAICQWIAQAHGGTLTAQSRLHRGSTFTVTLPAAPAMDESVEPIAADAPQSPEPAPTGRETPDGAPASR